MTLVNEQFAHLEKLDLVQLNARRTEIMAKGDPATGDGYSDEDLAEIVQISATLARRTSGPPKEPKAPREKKTKTPVTVDDLI